MENKMEKRKGNRLPTYDYSSCGVYFLTICTAERRNYFWNNVFETLQELPIKTHFAGICFTDDIDIETLVCPACGEVVGDVEIVAEEE